MPLRETVLWFEFDTDTMKVKNRCPEGITMITDTKGSVSIRTIFLLMANVGMLMWVLSSRASASRQNPSYPPGSSGGSAASASADAGTGQDLSIPETIQEDAPVQSQPVQPEATESDHRSTDPIPDEKLNLQMFDWYETDVRYNWFPQDAVQLTSLQDILGDWKAWVKYDPNNESGNSGDLLAFINIDPGQNDIAVTCDWYWTHYHKDPEGYYENEQSHFYGSFADGQLYTEGSGLLHIKYFCEYNGAQYGVGMMQTKEGVKAVICLMRP